MLPRIIILGLLFLQATTSIPSHRNNELKKRGTPPDNTKTGQDLKIIKDDVTKSLKEMENHLKDIEQAAAKKGILKPDSELEKLIAVLEPALKQGVEAVEEIGKNLAKGLPPEAGKNPKAQAAQQLKIALDGTSKLGPLVKDIPDAAVPLQEYQKAFDVVVQAGLQLLAGGKPTPKEEDKKSKPLIDKVVTTNKKTNSPNILVSSLPTSSFFAASPPSPPEPKKLAETTKILNGTVPLNGTVGKNETEAKPVLKSDLTSMSNMLKVPDRSLQISLFMLAQTGLFWTSSLL
ncbi:secreted protein [Melampsora americana]|nr:secreted protein [Melampsora americana]